MKVVRIIARLNVGGPARHVAWLEARLRGRGVESLLVASRPSVSINARRRSLLSTDY